MSNGRIYRRFLLAVCVLTVLGLAFGAQPVTQARSNVGIAAVGSIASPFAPLTGTDSRMSNPSFSGTQREYAIDINPNDPRYAVMVSIHGAVPTSVNSVYRTSDGGQTWMAQDAPFANTKDPSAAYSADGSVYAAGVSTAAPPTEWIMRSTDNGATYGAPVTVALGDRPTLVVDNGPTSPNLGTLYLVGLDTSTSATLVVMAKSSDQGQTWSAPMSVSVAPPAGGYNQAPMPRVASDGTIYVAYQEYSSTAACGAGNTIYNRLARSTNGGASWTQTIIGGGPIVQGGACIAAQVGRGIFCINGAAQSFRSRSHAILGVKPTDPNTVYAIYSGGDLDSAYTCGTGTGFHSDTVFTRSIDSGATWSPKTKVNGDAQGSDQFMPWMDVAPNGTIWAGWQDRREDPNNYLMRWYQASSTDGGNTWTEAPTADVQSQPGTSVGDYHGLAADNGQVLGVWLDTRDNASGDPYTEAHVLNAHLTWEGHPGTTSPRNEQPVSLSIKQGAGPTTNYPTQTTDGDGNFMVPDSVPAGSYTWRAKGPKFLAKTGTATLPATSSLDLGEMKAGDANNNNIVDATDFSILRANFGSTTDLRADFNDDGVVSTQDFTLMRANFGTAGAPPLAP